MLPVEETLLTLPMATVLGLVFGMSTCSLTCLPYLAPVFLASDGGMGRAWRTLLPFSLGRLTIYAGFSTLAGMAGQLLEGEGAAQGVRWVMGVAALVVGVALLLRVRSARTCNAPATVEVPLSRFGRVTAPRLLLPGGLFLMGVAIALTPCAPLAGVLYSAATVGDAWHGLALGLGFGVGAIAIPSLVYGVGLAHLGGRLREHLDTWKPRIERLSAVLLILVGIRNLLA